MNLFEAKLYVEIGLGCDCCVKVLSVEANVYASSELHAKDLLRAHYPHATLKIEFMENKGAVEQVNSPGVIVASSAQIFEGNFKSSPVYS